MRHTHIDLVEMLVPADGSVLPVPMAVPFYDTASVDPPLAAFMPAPPLGSLPHTLCVDGKHQIYSWGSVSLRNPKGPSCSPLVASF